MAAADLSVNLPWQGLAAGGQAMSQTFSGNPQQTLNALGPAYNQNYQAALGLNAGLYNQTQTGYQNLRSQLDQQYGDISKGYQNLYGDVLGKIAGTNQTNIQDINSQYDAQSGQQTQDAINHGLGNSTVQQNMQRAVALDRSRAITASQNQFAQLQAGYMSQLGQAGLQSQQQGAQTGANLGLDQLRFAGSAQAPYPNAGMYSQLAQQAGANQQRQQDQARTNQLMGVGQLRGGMPGGASGGANGFGSFLPPTSYAGSGGGGSFGGYSGAGTFFGGTGPGTGFVAPEGFQSGNFDSESGVGGYSIPPAQAMGAVGGGAMAALGYGGYGGLGQNPNQGYSQDPYGLPPMAEEQQWQGTGEGAWSGI